MKLFEVIAVEKGVKGRTYSALTELHKKAQKVEPYNGFSKTFQPKAEDGESYPPESRKVTLRAADVLGEIEVQCAEAFDLEARKDRTNMKAKADVVVGGRTIIEGAPVSLLLYLEKQITDVRTMVDSMPTLDENEEWSPDAATGLQRTSPAKSHKTRKVQQPIVLFPATEQHPAQTQLVSVDEIAGWWTTVKISGAIPHDEKKGILTRCDRLLKALKQARERANDIEVDPFEVGDNIFEYLFRS